MGLLDSWNADPSSSMVGLLSPNDRLMSIFAGLSNAGAAMSQPGLSRGQAMAQGFAGLGQGIAQSRQQALMQSMLGLKLKEAQQQSEWKKTLADAFGDTGTPGQQMAAAPGQTVAQGMADRMNGQRSDKMQDPKIQGALMGLYGPQGLAALRQEDKAPQVVDMYDNQGRKTKGYWDAATRKFVPLGGSEIDPSKLQMKGDGSVGYLPGVLESEAGMTGAKETAQQRAQLQYAGPKAGAAAAATSPYDIAKAWAIPRVLPPGGQVVAGGAPNSGSPAQVIMTSPNPSPGSQEGKLQGGIGELQSKTIEGWRTNAEAANVTLQNIARMREAVDNGLKTGTFAPVKQATVNALSDLGVSPDALAKFYNAPAGRAFDAAAKELVLPVVKSLGANPTNTDRDFIEATIPQLRDNPQAVKSLLDWMEKRAVSKMDLYKEGYAAHRAGKDPLEFEQDWWNRQRQPKGPNIDDLLKKYAP